MSWVLIAIGTVCCILGIGFFYAVGICDRCGTWSMKYTCPGCHRGRYDPYD
jgi:hypothetical protein